MSNFDSLITLIKNEPLIETQLSLASLKPSFLNTGDGNIFYGTGICTPKNISLGLPFDVLEMVFCAERIRRTIGFERVFHHIADTHAKTNKIFDENLINQKAKESKEVLEKVTTNLGLDHFSILLASDFDCSPDYQKILSGLSSVKHDYIIREIADIEWYRIYRNVKLKLGWVIQGAETELGHDERLFDQEYQEIIKPDMSFIYLKAGRTFNRSKPKASPYIYSEGENRILLRKDENVSAKLEAAEKKLEDKSLGGAKKYLSDIVRAYEKLFGNLLSMSLEEKIQFIINKVTQ